VGLLGESAEHPNYWIAPGWFGQEDCGPDYFYSAVFAAYKSDLSDAGRGTPGETTGILRAAALSEDERAVVRVIGERGPAATKVIYPAAKLAKTNGAFIVGNLRSRGVIRLTDDGYVVADAVWIVLASEPRP
jgi:hypothetical protein